MTSTYATPATVQSGYTGWRSALVLSAAEQHACLNLHRLHQLVLAGFRNPALSTAAPAERPPSVLYAADRGPARTDAEQRPLAGPPKAVLVQSPYQPNWQPLLDSGRLTRADTFPTTYEYTPGQQVDIRVIANPSYRETATRRRISLSSVAECGSWLRRRLAEYGVDVALHHIQVGERERMTGFKSDDHLITVICRMFQARGTVLSPDAFHQALAQGLGPAKAYGCGLLLTKPLADDEAW
ncbi:type I-E CRISPR-associated protein Cas6/Cse3/CasE [Streptomyces cellulosae]|uniref:Type I-E CRISPR-associated protein Cas6/Cse3/CasE n=1 Tax=Streptomyces althioticus TaxID=83380 RepID=A0ABZ1YJB1_9ACTN|nr:type I-E CRISPR-associated protein Cas6/Cse3/CasE [Streptomyces cellulosae]WTB93353.1 type I-E CRISPR-associated protein Cas6/Cse3/CasE [Streptomyces cellulosae]WTC60745.1 type I-E CRISPR-associated protein Cas6/Cse3/CasE [Streptomyces cellulosae]